MTVESSQTPLVRVFLSSTFRDFMEERDLLVKQVFPRLRQKAKRRGVELIDVDLRWGITEEESEQGKVIPICLAEIDRCKPYFIGMIGERYGWIPPANQYAEELQDREPWLKQHLGGVSVTELEVLHGVLNNPEMAGQAFFYFRDSNWSEGQESADFLCEGAKEEKRLEGLKQRIRRSGFPVTEDLKDPQAMAAAIEADLWELIEQQFPEQPELSLLEQEERKHAGYRHARTGLYLGGEQYLEQLETLIDAGEQRILITGESGCGKSALIANWAANHAEKHPADTIYCHHLSASADANQLRPLLARLINTASEQLLEAELISEPLKIPEDWWELTAKVAETLQTISALCKRENKRWILVLDGLDRLSAEDQQALPWLPLHIPERVLILASALECSAKEILVERGYSTLSIGPLEQKQQDALIERYLAQYTKKLKDERRQRLTDHPLAGSPLFLRVLLEEIRQCGRYEELDKQLDFYLSAETVVDLFERVLERLEADAGVEEVKAVMTALWASRSGLSETEVLAITGIAPLQWVPIELALAESFSRNGERITFGHDYLRIAVKDRYLSDVQKQKAAHSALADWFTNDNAWDYRSAFELIYQWQMADMRLELRDHILRADSLATLCSLLGNTEIIEAWQFAKEGDEDYLDLALFTSVMEVLQSGAHCDLQEDYPYQFSKTIADLLVDAGLTGELYLKLREFQLNLLETSQNGQLEEAQARRDLAVAFLRHGDRKKAKKYINKAIELRSKDLGGEHSQTLSAMTTLCEIELEDGNLEIALASSYQILEAIQARRINNPSVALGAFTCRQRCLEMAGQNKEMASNWEWAMALSTVYFGKNSEELLITKLQGARYLANTGQLEQANDAFIEYIAKLKMLLGNDSPSVLSAISNHGVACAHLGLVDDSVNKFRYCVKIALARFGEFHPITIGFMSSLAGVLCMSGKHNQALEYSIRAVDASSKIFGREHQQTIEATQNLASICGESGRTEEAYKYEKNVFEMQLNRYGRDNPSTLYTMNNMGVTLLQLGRFDEALSITEDCFVLRNRVLGASHHLALATLANKGIILLKKGNVNEGIRVLESCISARDGAGLDSAETEGLRNIINKFI